MTAANEVMYPGTASKTHLKEEALCVILSTWQNSSQVPLSSINGVVVTWVVAMHNMQQGVYRPAGGSISP